MGLFAKSTISVLLVMSFGMVGGLITSQAIPGWYDELNFPPGVPSQWVFPVVWSILYFLIGLSAARFWHYGDEGPIKQTGWKFFVIQMALNFFWTPIFFGAHWLGVALVEITILAICIVATVIVFRRLEKIAAILLLPYLAWVCYATYITAGVWWLNR